MGPVYEEQISEFVEALRLFGKDVDGSYVLEELATVIKALDQNRNEEELMHALSKDDADANENTEFGEFLNQMTRKMKEIDAEEELREVFKVFDGDQNGFISANEGYRYLVGSRLTRVITMLLSRWFEPSTAILETGSLQNVMISLGEKLTEEEADQMIKEADLDGAGRVNYQDFVQMMTKI